MNVVTETKAAHRNVYVALAAAQMEFGTVTKNSTNPAFKSRYADLSDVASVVIPTLARHGVAVLHYLTGDGLSAMRTEFVHGESESRVWCDVPLVVDKNNMQGMKSATTYAKRIGLESLSGVAPDDDDGNGASKAPPLVDRRQEPAKRPDEGVSHAVAAIGNADTLDRLRAIFTDLPAPIRAHPDVIAAKDRRKAALHSPVGKPETYLDATDIY